MHVRTTDGITNGGVIFTVRSNSPGTVAVIWVHGQTVNFYEPTYLNILRAIASRGYTTLAGNTRMHDLGNVAGYRGQVRIRGGAYWGVPTEQVRDSQRGSASRRNEASRRSSSSDTARGLPPCCHRTQAVPSRRTVDSSCALVPGLQEARRDRPCR